MPSRQPDLPRIWLVSDLRNDASLERVLARLPRGSGLIFRHYHLSDGKRQERFAALRRLAQRRGLVVALSGDVRTARRWRADAAYGAPLALARGPAFLRLVTAHSLREIGRAPRARADAVLLSPVFPTRSHPGSATLGAVRFRLLAARSRTVVIALGGMSERRASRLKWPRWAAIDSLCDKAKVRIPKDS